MSDSGLTSIIMPVYNARNTLAESVDSIFRQSHPDWELILIDDRSKDGSAEVIRDLASRDSRVRSLFLDSNVGAARARNAGIEIAKGRYIAFLDADDLWHEEKLSRQIAVMRDTKAGMSFTDYEWIGPTGNSLGIVVQASDNPTWGELTWGNNIGLSTTIIDQSMVGSPVMHDIRLNHDYALWLELLRRGFRAVRLPEVLVRYRVLPGSLSRNKLESAWYNWVILRRFEGLSVFRTAPRLLVWALRASHRRFVRGRSLG